MLSFAEAREYAEHLRSRYARLHNIQGEMERMFLMEWDDEARVRRQMDNIKLTISPEARNAVIGAARLMTASDPIFSVPFDEGDIEGERTSERVEEMVKRLWRLMGRMRGAPLHYDMVLSALLYGEMVVTLTATSDLAAIDERGAALAERTPYLAEVVNPRECYGDWDILGLRAFYRETEMMGAAIAARFEGADGLVKPYDKAVLCDFWDTERRYTWVQGSDARPLIDGEEHGLPFIPVVFVRGEGSDLFGDEEYRRTPFLYALWRSGLWERQNLLLTVMYTQIFNIGANPMWVHYQGSPDADVEMDFSTPGGIATVPPGSRLEPMGKNVIDPSLSQGWELTRDMLAQSTLYRQALGEPVGANAPFSYYALLSQSGRLPLIATQRMSGFAIAKLMQMALTWMRMEGGGRGDGFEFRADEIPERVRLECKLDIALPQDKLQQSNIATMLVQSGLASRRWVRENILNVGQSDAMQAEIWSEAAAEMRAQGYFQMMMQQQAQQQAQPPVPPGAADAGGGMPMPGPGAGGDTGGANPAMMGGQLPPEMFAGGGGPPEQARGMPPAGPGGDGGMMP